MVPCPPGFLELVPTVWCLAFGVLSGPKRIDLLVDLLVLPQFGQHISS